MTKTKERKKPVVGQMVYVVFGRKRGSGGELHRVVRVGKKYAYICPYGGNEEEPFSLDSWQFHDSEGNANQNGYGFDVYESKEDYERQKTLFRERSRLSERIGSDLYYSAGLLNRLPHDAVMKIHAILDEVEAGKVEDGDE